MKTQSIIRLGLLFLAVNLALYAPGTGFAKSSTLQTNAVQIVYSSPNELVLKVNVPEYNLVDTPSSDGICKLLKVDGWDQAGEPGHPALAMKGVLLGIPYSGEPSLTIDTIGHEVQVENVNLCPVIQIVASTPLPNQPLITSEQISKNLPAYTANVFLPSDLATLEPLGYIRSQRVARLVFQPIQYNPVTQQLRIMQSIQVRINFGTSGLTLETQKIVNEVNSEGLLNSAILNYQEARAWRTPTQVISTVQDTASTTSSSPVYQIAIKQDGIYRLTYNDLNSAGLPLSAIDPRTFRLTNRLSEVSIFIQGEEDGSFDNGDFILFLGQKNISRYSDTNIYSLTWGGENGLRMNKIDGTPGIGSVPVAYLGTSRSEQNKYYFSNLSNDPNRDRWFWDFIIASSTTGASLSFTINLPHVSSLVSSNASFRGFLKGSDASPQHHTRIYLNEVLVKEDYWPAKADYAFEVSVAQSLLLEGPNTIKIESPLGDGITDDFLLVDWFEIRYLKNFTADNNLALFSSDAGGLWEFKIPGFSNNNLSAFDISDPIHPYFIDNLNVKSENSSFTLDFQTNSTEIRKYIVASTTSMLAVDSIIPVTNAGLKSPTNGADYLIISHPDFLAAVQPLAEHYTALGMRTRVINVQDIYNEFNAGNFDPQAIHDFLAYTYSNWTSPAPSYVLLVGDGNLDFKNYIGRNEINYIPPYLADVDPVIIETAADNRYVTVSGDDYLPDMALGRLPVKSAAEATASVSKILAYANSNGTDWIHHIAMVADQNDGTGSFTGSADIISSMLPSQYLTNKIYSMVTYPTIPATRSAILTAFNSGNLIIHYNGHSNPYGWSANDLLTVPNITAISNNNNLPFLISITCVTGYYIYPSNAAINSSSLDESLFRAAGGGIIGSFSPTGYGYPTGHDILDEGLINAIFQKRIVELGQSMNAAKYYLAANSTSNLDLLDTYILFGDPATNLKLDLAKFYVPLVSK